MEFKGGEIGFSREISQRAREFLRAEKSGIAVLKETWILPFGVAAQKQSGREISRQKSAQDAGIGTVFS